ncbi:uncharacterized protein SGFS_071570 [Streptomyces graminofaciens]|uniref:Uncharacterized protein n=1 Tax=Streptomyces graminofaciens TaxID=68212 RepID=A0ABN5VTM5_9ACTN|nr:hypothetical protein [Streptomyces graminofaciens]BBC35863.1 uncharacterized protein SGFS_071570 [Streptomyces graminofaciens]
MKYLVAGREAVTAAEFAELALGTPVELWLGVEGETEEERAARLDAARDILADPEFASLPDDLVRLAARVVDDHPELFDVVPLVRPARRRPVHRGAAA